MLPKKCPDCNTKLRNFKGGFICQKNHKFLPGSKLYTEIHNQMKIFDDIQSGKIDTSLYPECQTSVVEMCKCHNGEMRCINNHIWTSKYYQGDKRYLCINPPNDGMYVFNFD